MSPHDNGQPDDRDATNYAAPPAASTDAHDTRYSDAPADPHATAYTPTADATDPTAAGRLPRRFGGYELLEELGHGGMGVVYKARQLSPERLVALKVIRSGELADAEDVRRFRQEADEAARLDHPHITPVYEVGEQGGLHFFTMKLVEGGSLAQHLNRYQSDPKAAAKLTATAARAVHYAHQRQLLHRDLKPGNILLDAAGQPHVADFGLAKRMGGAGEASQSSGVGTPEYMAPEQARGDARLTTAADVYALGGVLYALLTGRPPFSGDSPWATIEKVLTEEPTPPSKIRPGVSRDLETICLKCLQKEPARRYGSAEALAEDLERWLRGEPIRARSVGAMERVAKWARRKPAAAAAYGLLLAALVLGAGGGGATWLWLNAEKARGDAETAKGDAQAAQTRAEIAKGEADTAKRGEQQARRELMQYTYIDRINLAQREWDAGEIKHARELLDEANSLQADLTSGLPLEQRSKERPWELDYLNRRLHPELFVLEYHACEDISPDFSRIASGGNDNKVRLLDAASGKQLAVCVGHTGSVKSVHFSPDGARLASVDENTIRLWDAISGKQLAVLAVHTKEVVFSPDGTRLASVDENTIRLWDAISGKQLAVLAVHTKEVVFSPDGTRLASVDENTIRLWDAISGKQLVELGGPQSTFTSVGFSPDGTRLVTAEYRSDIKLWDAATGKQLAAPHWERPTDFTFSIAYSPDGVRLASEEDGSVRLWDAASGKELAVFYDSRGPVFSPDGVRAAIISGNNVQLWDAASGRQLALLQGHTKPVLWVAFSPDGSRLASIGSDSTVRLWDAFGGQPTLRKGNRREFSLISFNRDGSQLIASGRPSGIDFSDPPDPFYSAALAFSPDGTRLASYGLDKTVRLWDAASGKQLVVLQEHTGKVNKVKFSPDGGRLASAGEDKTVRLWDAASGKQLVVLKGEGNGFYSLAFSPDGTRLASANSDGMVTLWHTASGKQLAVLQGHTGRVNCLAFSPDGKWLATGDFDKTVRLWDAASGKQLAMLEGHTDSITSMAFSPDGSKFASSDFTKSVRLWNLASCKQLAVLKGNWEPVFSPDSARLALCGDDLTVRLCDATSGKQLALLEGHTETVNSVAFSPDGTRLASAGMDRTVRLWDAATGKQLAVLDDPRDWVSSVAFSPDSDRLVSGEGIQMIQLWIAHESRVNQEKRRHFWREQQAAALEKQGFWFAATFHLSRLIDADPADATLYARRCAAEFRLGRWHPAAVDFLQALTRWQPADEKRQQSIPTMPRLDKMESRSSLGSMRQLSRCW